MSDVFDVTALASLWTALKASTPVETAVLCAVLAGLYLVYATLVK